MKVSDFLTTKELRQREIYWEYFHPWGVEYQISVGLDAPLSHTKVFVLDRMGGRDFTERDRAVLDLLRPHLASLYAAAQVRRRARECLRSARANRLCPRGSRPGRTSSSTRRPKLSASSGPTFVSSAVVFRWNWRRGSSSSGALRGGNRSRCQRGDVSLLVHLVDDSLFLEEQRDAPRLTEREREIHRPGCRGQDQRRDRRDDLGRARHSPQASGEHLREARSPQLGPPPSRPSMARDSSQREIFRGRRNLVE